MDQLSLIDYVVLVAYFAVVAWVGLRAARGKKTTSKYFVADRSIPAWAVGFTLMATMISSGTIVGHPATVFKDGMILLLGSCTLVLVLLVVARHIVPFYRNVVRLSAYEYLGKRFGFGGRLYASAGFVVDRVFDLGVTLIATALALHVMTQWSIVLVILGLGVFTIAYTVVGGIEAVVWTNAVQGVILLGGGLVILGFLLLTPAAGAPGATLESAWNGGRFYLGSFELSWESLFDTTVTTQWLFLLAYVTNWGRRYVCDQHMVQRYLLARSDREACTGALWGACSCVPVWALFMLIGACLYGYYELTPLEPPEIGDELVPRFLVNTFPAGLVGLILAAIMAAAMSSLSSDLNAVASVLTVDHYGRLFPEASDRQQLWFGRLMVCVAGVAATLVAVLMIPDENTTSLMERVVTILAVLSGGVLGLFALGFLTRTATKAGCYTGIVACLLFTAWGVVTQGDDSTRLLDLGFNFQMHPILIGVFGHVVLFVVGYATSRIVGGYRPPDEELQQLTVYWRQAEAE